MRSIISELVKAGDLIRIGPWLAMQRVVRALRLISGPNVRLRTGPNGTYITFDGAFNFWAHPFKCSISETAVSVRPGSVSTLDATIDKIPLDGGEKGEVPVLKLPGGLKLRKDGKGWVAVEITCDAKWIPVSAEIVQVADLTTADGSERSEEDRKLTPYLGGVPSVAGKGRKARHPLAVIRRRADGSLATWQATHHNLQHRARFDSPNDEAVRHFFWPS